MGRRINTPSAKPAGLDAEITNQIAPEIPTPWYCPVHVYRSRALVLSFRSLSFVLYITWCIVLYLDPIKSFKLIIISVFYIDSTSSLAQSLTNAKSQQPNLELAETNVHTISDLTGRENSSE